MSNTQLTVPCHWDSETIRQLISLPQQNGISIGEVYGALAKGGPVGHGRASSSVANITPEDAVAYHEYLNSVGLNLTYLLNAPFKLKNDAESKVQLQTYLEWILQVLRPEAVTIASLELMEEVRKIDPEIAIHISTVAGIKNVRDLEQYLHIRPNRIVPHHDVGKDWHGLEELVEMSNRYGIDVEMMATESCLLHCPNRQAHYEHLACQGPQDAPFHTSCNTRKLVRPREFLLAGGIIRPEDVHLYEEMGVKYIKLTGRSKPAEWLPEVVNAYLQRNYEGNLVRLMGIDPSMRAEDWIHINNKSLNGFIEGFPQNGSYREQSAYCDTWMIRLNQEGAFRISDGSEYSPEGDALALRFAGEQVNHIISKERER